MKSGFKSLVDSYFFVLTVAVENDIDWHGFFSGVRRSTVYYLGKRVLDSLEFNSCKNRFFVNSAKLYPGLFLAPYQLRELTRYRKIMLLHMAEMLGVLQSNIKLKRK